MNLSVKEKLKLIELTESAHYVLEYGCGESSVLLSRSKNLRKLVSVESDPEWAEKISQYGFNNHQVHYIEINAKSGDWGEPQDSKFRDQWILYPMQVFAEQKLDVIFVDGRFRVACCATAYLKLEQSGLLIVHDYQRTEYHTIEEFFNVEGRCEQLAWFKKKPEKEAEALRCFCDHAYITF